MQRKYDFLVFLTRQASKEVKEKTEKTLFLLCYAIDKKQASYKQMYMEKMTDLHHSRLQQRVEFLNAVKRWKRALNCCFSEFSKKLQNFRKLNIQCITYFISYMNNVIPQLKQRRSYLWKVKFRKLARYWRRIIPPGEKYLHQRIEIDKDTLVKQDLQFRKGASHVNYSHHTKHKHNISSILCYQGLRKIAVCFLAIAMAFTVIPSNVFTVKAATNQTGLHTVPIAGKTFTTDEHEIMAYRKITESGVLNPNATYDIYGKVNDKWVKTTYQYSSDIYSNGYVPKVTNSNVNVVATPTFINEGRYIQMNYTLSTNSSSVQTTNFSIAADIMIDQDDKATITAFSDRSGFKMVSSIGQQFNFYGKNVYGTEPGISTMWYGYYNNRDSYRYNDNMSSSFSGGDSGMATSWKNIQVKPGEAGKASVSMIIGIGEANVAPEISDVVVPGGSNVEPGKDIEIQVPVSNSTGDNAPNKLTLYYTLEKLNGEIITGPIKIEDVETNVTDRITTFIAKFKIPENMPSGQFNLKVFAMNDKGGISAQVQKTMQATAAAIQITSVTDSFTILPNASKTLTVNITSSSGAKSYQWQRKEGTGTWQNVEGATAVDYTYEATSDDIDKNVAYRCKVAYQGDESSAVYSNAVNVTVNKHSSTTTLTTSYNKETNKTTLTSSTSSSGTVSGVNVNFYNGGTLLGTKATDASGKASLEVDNNLTSGNYVIQAVFSGSATAYSSSTTKELTINMKQKIIYDEYIKEADPAIVRDYYEGLAQALKDPTIGRDGYVFLGFVIENTSQIIKEISAMMRGEVRLQSVWKSTQFNVVIDDSLGSETVTEKGNANKTFSYTAPERTGYTFSNWVCSDPSLIAGKEQDKTLNFTMPEKDITLKAVYSLAEYTITYTEATALTSWPKTYTYSVERQLPTPVQEGKQFVGWKLNGEMVSSISATTSGNITLEAVWKDLHNVTVSYTANSVDKKIVYEYAEGEEVFLAAPSIEGYEVVRWESTDLTNTTVDDSKNLTFKMVDKNVNLQVILSPISYNITYDLKGIDANIDELEKSYTYGTETVLKSPSKVGYTFGGWYTDDTLKTQKSVITATDKNDVKLYAKWTQNAYLVSVSDGTIQGTTDSSRKVNYGETITLTPATKQGYTFTGWTTSPQITITDNSFTMPDHAVNISANYKKTNFKIEYKNVSDLDPTLYPTSYVLGYSMELRAPQKAGYTFTGWYTDEGLTKKVTSISAQDTGDKVFYAGFKINQYTVTLDGGTFDDGSTSKTVDFDSELKITANTKTGMNFVNWNTTQEVSNQSAFTFKVPASNTVLQAKFENASYTISYDLNEDEANKGVVSFDSKPDKYIYGSSITLGYPTAISSDSNNPTALFNGWVTTINGVEVKVNTIEPTRTGDLALKATWVEAKYAIKYTGIEGASNQNVLNDSEYSVVDDLTRIPLKIPEKIGYIFKAWEVVSDATGTLTISNNELTIPKVYTGDIVLNATWEPKQYNFDVDSGSSNNVEFGKPALLEAPEKTGKVFVNWEVPAGSNVILENAANSKTKFVLTADVATWLESDANHKLSFVPVYRNAEYNITYSGLENTDVNNNPATYTYLQGVQLVDPVRAGYTFEGWELNGTAITEISTEKIGNLELVATFAPIDYEVTIDNPSLSSTYHVGDKVTLTIPTKEGYRFNGYSVIDGDVTISEDYKEFTMPAGDVTLEANFTLETYTISYLDGTTPIVNSNPAQYTINDEITLSDPVKEGYQFLGWYDNANFDGTKVTVIKGATENKTLYAKFEKQWNTVNFTVKGLGTINFSVDDVTTDLTNLSYSTQELDKNIRFSLVAGKGYEVISVKIDGVVQDLSQLDYRMRSLYGVHNVEIVFSGNPQFDDPTSSNTTIKWTKDNTKLDPTYTKDDITISIDNKEGAKLSYQLVGENGTPSESGWLAYPADGIKITTEGVYVVYIKKEDGDGNSAVIHSNVIHLDKTAPTLNITDGENIYVDTSYTTEDKDVASITVDGVTVESVNLSGNVDKNYTVVITDKAGNATAYVVTAHPISDLEDVEAVADVTEETATSKHTELLNKAIAALKALPQGTAQQSVIDGYIKKYEDLKEVISKNSGNIENLIKQAEALTAEDIKVENKAVIEKLIANLESYLEGNSLTEDEKEELKPLLERVKDMDALISILEAVEEHVNIDEVTSDDKEVLESIVTSIEKETTEGNEWLVGDIKTKFDDHLKNAKKCIIRINETSTKMNDIKNFISSLDTSVAMSFDDKEGATFVINSLLSGDNITSEERTYLDAASKLVDVLYQMNDVTSLTKEEITTDKKESLESIKNNITDILDSTILSETQKENLKKKETALGELLDTIEQIETSLSEVEDFIQNNNLSKPIGSELITQVEKTIEELLNGKNLTEEQREDITNSKEVVVLVKEIQSMHDVTIDSVKPDDKESLETILEHLQDMIDKEILDSEKQAELKKNQDTGNSYIDRIEEVEEEIKNTKDFIDNLDPSKPLDADEIKAVDEVVESLLKKDNLTEEDRAYLENVKDVVDVLEKVVIIEGLHKDTVTADEKETLEEAKDLIKDVVEESTILTEEQKESLKEKETAADELLEAIKKVEDAIGKVEDFIKDNDLSKPIKDTIIKEVEKTIEELLNGTNLTEEQRKDITNSKDIVEVVDEIQGMHDMTIDSVTVGDKDTLETILEHLKDVVDKAILDQQKQAELEKNQNTGNSYVDRIEEVEKDIEKTKDFIKDNDLSKPIEKDIIKDVEKTIEDLLNGTNLTEEQRKDIVNSKEIVELVDEIQGMHDLTIDSVKPSNSDSLEKILEHLKEVVDKAILDQQKQTELKKNQDTGNSYVERIEEVKTAWDALQKAKPGTDASLEALEDYLQKLKEFKTKYGNNVDSDVVTTLNQTIQDSSDKIGELKRITSVEFKDGDLTIIVKGEDGLDFPSDIKIDVKEIKGDLTPEFLNKVNEDLQQKLKNAVIRDIYEITLTRKDELYQFDGLVEVRIKLNDAQLQYKGIGVIYISINGTIQEIPCTIEDGYAIFKTSHFSKYAIFEKFDSDKDTDSIIKDTASHSESGVDKGLLLMALAGGFLLLKKRKSA